MTKLEIIRAAALACLLPGLCAARAEPAPRSDLVRPSCGAQALGVSRTLAFSPQGGLKIGHKSYEQTLALDDLEVVLTFDDGPGAGTTAKVLEALAAECVRATFFLVGKNAQEMPQLVRRELAEGHTVGHHSFSHPVMRDIGEAAAKANIEKGFEADDKSAYGAAGSAPRVPFFRYPGFADTPELNAWLAARGIGVFGADLWSSDWIAMTPERQLDLTLSRLEATRGGILLMHDTKAQTAAMLPQLLREMKRRGFRIVHIMPGEAPAPLRRAPPGWTSETENFLKRRHAPAPPAQATR